MNLERQCLVLLGEPASTKQESRAVVTEQVQRLILKGRRAISECSGRVTRECEGDRAVGMSHRHKLSGERLPTHQGRRGHL
jgi:hypothetical protein